MALTVWGGRFGGFGIVGLHGHPGRTFPEASGRARRPRRIGKALRRGRLRGGVANPVTVWGRERLPVLLKPWRDGARGLDRRVWLVVTITLLSVASRMSVYTFIGIYFTRVVGIPITLVGAAFLLENVVRGVTMPLAGALSDRLGRKPVLAWATFTTALILPAFYFVPGPISLFAWSVAIGLSQAPLWPAASALLLDLAPPSRRQSVLALNYTMIAVGYTIGVIPAGFLVQSGYGLLALASALGFGAALAITLFGLRNLPDTGHVARRTSLARDLQVAPRDGAFVTLAAFALVFPLGIGLVVAAMPVYASEGGMGEAQIGIALAVNGPLLALLALPINATIERRGPYRFLPFSATFLVASYLVAAWEPSLAVLTLSVIVFTGGELIFSAALPTAVASLAPEGMRGAYQGAWGFVFSVSSGASLFLSGVLKDAFGWRATWLFWAGATAIAGVALLAVRPRLRRIADARAAGPAAP